jgi:hypothetical protein
MPSSTDPNTIAFAEPSCCEPPESLRPPPPDRSIPSSRPTSSNETEPINTPVPSAMMIEDPGGS